MKKILITHHLPIENIQEIQNRYHLLIPEKGMINNDLLHSELSKYNALLPTYAFKVTKEIIDEAKELQIIANFGAGYDNIDIDYASKKGILVTNSPIPVIEPTAELAFTLMLNVARRVCECDRKLRKKDKMQIGVMNNLGIGLYGKTLGIIGMGKIGQAVARRANAFGMHIIYYNRHTLDKTVEEKYRAKRVEINELLTSSDFISLHAPANSGTYHLIDTKEINLMKSNAILINTARGSLINEQALIPALKEHRIFGAGLDVFEHEPDISSELLELDNVILSPHNGTGTIDARTAMTKYAIQNILNFFEGKKVLSPINK